MTLFRVVVWAALAAFFVSSFSQTAQAAYTPSAEFSFEQPCAEEPENCRLSPPQSIHVNPAVQYGQADLSEIQPSGSLNSVQVGFGLQPGSSLIQTRAVVPLPKIQTLEVEFRPQDPGDCTCGVHALGMALAALEGPSPHSDELIGTLSRNRLIYGFGTGVEELAYAAQVHGHDGAHAFHDWSLEQLAGEIALGRPVVVAFTESAKSEQGHFVTVTGLSEDQRWIAYSDPLDGRVVVSMDSFLKMWQRQGNSGVAFGLKPIVANDDGSSAGWIVAIAALLTVMGATPALGGAGTRKGVGAGRIALDAGITLSSGPPYPPPHGYRWVPSEVPVYKRRKVQKGWTIDHVPRMVRQRKQIGWSIEKIAHYRTVTVQQGWNYETVRVPKYTTTKVYLQSPVYQNGRIVGSKKSKQAKIKKILSGYKTVIRRTPRIVTQQVFSYWEEKKVPRYAWIEVQEGWDEVRLPKYERIKVRIGSRIDWKLRKQPKRAPSSPGYTASQQSTDPSWLALGEAPPWISDSLWGSLSPGDRDVILKNARDIWQSWLESGSLTSDSPIDLDKPAKIFDSYHPPGTKALPLWIRPSDGVNLRSSPTIDEDGNLIRRLTFASDVDWSGKVYLENLPDGTVRFWYKIKYSEEEKTWKGWVSSDYLASYASGNQGDAGNAVQRATLGYGKGIEGWSDYNNGNAAQYLNLRLLFQSLGDEEYGNYAFPHYGLCGPISVSEALGVPLEKGLQTFRDEVSKEWLLEENKYGTTRSSQLGALFDAFGWKAEIDYGKDNLNAALNGGETVIALVTIDGQTGSLDAQGNVAHWVHVRDVKGAELEIYNPFDNRYSRIDTELFAAAWAQTPNNSSQSLFISADR